MRRTTSSLRSRRTSISKMSVGRRRPTTGRLESKSSQSEFFCEFLTQKELDPDAIAFNSNNSRYHFPARFYVPFRGVFGQSDPLIKGFKRYSALVLPNFTIRTSPYLFPLDFPVRGGIKLEEELLDLLLVQAYIYSNHSPTQFVDPTGLQDTFPTPPKPPRGGADLDPGYWKKNFPAKINSMTNCAADADEIRRAFEDAWKRVTETGPGANTGAKFKKKLLNCFAKIDIICQCCNDPELCSHWKDPSNLYICIPRKAQCGSLGASIIHELTHCAQGREEGQNDNAADYYYPDGGGKGAAGNSIGDGTKY